MAGVDEGVPDLALARLQIWSVVTGAKVGDLDPSCIAIEAVRPASADLLSKNLRGSSFGWRVERESRYCVDDA